ncbi:pilin [Patescibacteria group bacterium]|nr:pilin [Patescibacteria group bacterium]
MKIINKIFFSLLTLFLASPVFAARTDDGGAGGSGGTVEPPTLGEGIDGILDNVMKLIFPIAGIVCVVFIIIGGYTWIASAGDPAKIQQAQGTLTWAIIGLVFVLIAALIISTVTKFLA